jgi:hypothetical protein
MSTSLPPGGDDADRQTQAAANERKDARYIPSGAYDPGPVDGAELAGVEAWQNDLQLEEFPDGPYAAASDPPRLGKSSPWRPGQRVVSSFRDQNPVTSERKVAAEEPPFDAPEGSIEGEN